MSLMEEPELVEKLKNRDEDAFRLIVNKYQRSVLNSCYRFVNDSQTAEDLTQEVFIEVYRSVGNFRNESKLLTWIYRIAVFKSLDFLKSQKRKKRFAVIKSLFGEDEMEERIAGTDENGPAKQLENKESARILAWAIDKLPENQRIAFSLSKYDELSYNEIAEILGTTISSVESLIHRAKSNLKKRLFNYYKNHL